MSFNSVGDRIGDRVCPGKEIALEGVGNLFNELQNNTVSSYTLLVLMGRGIRDWQLLAFENYCHISL